MKVKKMKKRIEQKTQSAKEYFTFNFWKQKTGRIFSNQNTI
jgi:hypothetical protein